MTRVLTIDGTDYDVDGWNAAGLSVDAFCAWDLDGDSWLEFHEIAAAPWATWQGRKSVEYRRDGVLRFKGVTTLAEPGETARHWGYRCQGLKLLMNEVTITAPDFSGQVTYNLPLTDEESTPTRRGLSVGDIIAAVLDMHAAQLAAIGISTDATTAAQLASLTVVPNGPVHVSGELAHEVESLLQRWAGNVRMAIPPTGEVRFVDAAGLGTTGGAAASHVLTYGVDEVHPPSIGRDWSACAPRVVAYGRGRIYPFNGRMALDPSELRPAWTSGQQADWSDVDFTAPGDATDYGVVTTTSGPTTITVQSDDPTRAWPVNFWPKRGGWVQLRKATGIGLEYQINVPVSACTALTAGGTSTLTLDLPLESSASDAWDTYQLVGRTGPLEDDGSGTSLSNVWRLFDVVTPGGLVEGHLALSSPIPIPFYGLNNASAVMIQTPAALLVKDGVTFPASFRVLPETGQILFDEPIVRAWSSADDLAIGGAAVSPPDDILFMVPYARGPLQVAHPPDVGGVPQYAGTSHTVGGMTKTLYVYIPDWRYEGNAPLIQQYVEMLHRTLCDVQVAATVIYEDVRDDLLDVGDGHELSFAAECGTTGLETLAIPVRSVVVRIPNEGRVTTEVRTTNRVEWRTDPGLYVHSMSRLGSGPSIGLPMDADFTISANGTYRLSDGSPLNFTVAAGEPAAPVADPLMQAAGFAQGGNDGMGGMQALDADWSAPGGNVSGKYAGPKKYKTARPYRTTKTPYRRSRKFSSTSEADKAAGRAKMRAEHQAESQARRDLGASRRDVEDVRREERQDVGEGYLE